MPRKGDDAIACTCMTCKNATLMRWFQNPVISQCNARNVREVASVHRYCKFYIEEKARKEITQME